MLYFVKININNAYYMSSDASRKACPIGHCINWGSGCPFLNHALYCANFFLSDSVLAKEVRVCLIIAWYSNYSVMRYRKVFSFRWQAYPCSPSRIKVRCCLLCMDVNNCVLCSQIMKWNFESVLSGKSIGKKHANLKLFRLWIYKI